jgi:poly-gamma-glutamate capsule biosynthesis protein CapA/YwtB (metallophosphatase superfamily)
VGAGLDRAAAEASAVLTVRGVRIGILAFMDDERWSEARPGRPGRFYSPLDLGDRRACRVLEAVRRLRPDVDVLIASAHWGPNFGDSPPAAGRAFGRALIEAGADLVFGHSAHVTRGIEVHRGRAILHAAGDVLDDYAVGRRGRTDHGAIFRAPVEDGRVASVTVIPVVIRNARAMLASGAEATTIGARIVRLTRRLGTREARLGPGGVVVLAVGDRTEDAVSTWP